jgi:hypothetical protein
MFKVIEGEAVSGRLVYHRADRAVDVEPRLEKGVASLLVNDIHLELNNDGILIYAWGFCPHESWLSTTLIPPTLKYGRLHYVGEPITPGISKRLGGKNPWPVAYDCSIGWLCVGNSIDQADAIAFAPGSVASLLAGELVALWLHLDKNIE